MASPALACIPSRQHRDWAASYPATLFLTPDGITLRPGATAPINRLWPGVRINEAAYGEKGIAPASPSNNTGHSGQPGQRR